MQLYKQDVAYKPSNQVRLPSFWLELISRSVSARLQTLCEAVMICATLVNIYIHSSTAFDRL